MPGTVTSSSRVAVLRLVRVITVPEVVLANATFTCSPSLRRPARLGSLVGAASGLRPPAAAVAADTRRPGGGGAGGGGVGEARGMVGGGGRDRGRVEMGSRHTADGDRDRSCQ